MRAITGVGFEDEDLEVFARVVRWINLHPRAVDASARPSQARRDGTLASEFRASLNAILEHREVHFSEGLERLHDFLSETLGQALLESEVDYWTDRSVHPEGARVLVEAHQTAVADLQEAVSLVTDAQYLAQPARFWRTEKEEAL